MLVTDLANAVDLHIKIFHGIRLVILWNRVLSEVPTRVSLQVRDFVA